MLEIEHKRITLFMGHYGSGKTFVSVNYATYLSSLNKSVAIYDLDIVNPYFRTIDAKEYLQSKNVELIVSPFAQTNVDLPSINSASYKMIDDKSKYAVVDIGGDDRGALALGRFADKIKQENDYNCLLVVNKFRPETKDIDGVLQIKDEIERVSKISFTGLINNSNLGKDTTYNDILSGQDFIKEVCKKTNLEVLFTSIRKDLINQQIKKEIKNVLPVIPIKYGDWL